MKKQARRLLGLVLAAGLALGGTVTGWADAISTYSVSVGQGVLSILRAGKVTNSFRTSSSDVTAMTASDGNLMVCFSNAQGEYVGVALGSQEIVNFYGAIGTLRLDDSLDRPVVIGSSARVTKLKVDAPVKVSVWGRVESGTVDAAASIVTAKGSQISNLYFENSGGRLYVNEGSVVDGTTILNSGSNLAGSSSGSSGSSSRRDGTTSRTVDGITLKTTKIYADYDDTLGELVDELNASVEAYNRRGRSLDGTVKWVDTYTTSVDDGGRFRFEFTPDDNEYPPVTSTIRVVVDEDVEYEDVYLDYPETLEVSRSNNPKRLSYYLSRLENKVEAYNDDGRRIYGEVKWSGSNKKVEDSDYYYFTFTPYSSKYKVVKDKIYIELVD